MFSMLHDLQHPANCSAARKLYCDLNKGCGFGCQLHHVVHCMTHAVALNRTLIMQVRRQDSWHMSSQAYVITGLCHHHTQNHTCAGPTAQGSLWHRLQKAE
jgi:hypothetical protein